MDSLPLTNSESGIVSSGLPYLVIVSSFCFTGIKKQFLHNLYDYKKKSFNVNDFTLLGHLLLRGHLDLFLCVRFSCQITITLISLSTVRYRVQMVLLSAMIECLHFIQDYPYITVSKGPTVFVFYMEGSLLNYGNIT